MKFQGKFATLSFQRPKLVATDDEASFYVNN